MKLRFFQPRSAGASASGQAPLLPPGALGVLNRLKLNTGPFTPGAGAGMRPSPQRRPSVDFREHRMYAPGDDVRFVDWRASARQEHVYIKQGEYLKDARVYLVLDLSASMAWGSPPKTAASLALAAALGYLALSSGDRLVVLPVAGRPVHGQAGAPSPSALPLFGPISGKGQFTNLLAYLRALTFSGQVDLSPSLAGLRKRAVSNGGLVLVLSDLLGARNLESALEALPRPKWSVAVLHLLHPRELDPTLNGDFELQDIETSQKKRYTITPQALETYRKRLQAWQNDLAGLCAQKHAQYTLISTGWSLENEVLPHLRHLNIITPA